MEQAEQKKVSEVIKLLAKEYPGAKYYLDFSNPLELLVAAILSAQVRDEVVNALTPRLFKKYRTAKDYADADLRELESDIKSVTFAANKAKYVKSACRALEERFGGKVPAKMEDLTRLSGVGRKTANTILINAFGIVEGIPADTHVIRIANRLGWSKGKNGDQVEQDLMKIVPKGNWKKIPYELKAHGRAVCMAPVPVCSKCVLDRLCPKVGVVKKI
jgi:endonuclease-3